MNRSVLLSLLSVVCALSLNAQTIKPVESAPDDYIRLLQANGYNSYAFDISSLSDRRYSLIFMAQEYAGGKKVSDNVLYTFRIDNMRMVSDFDEKDQATIKPEEMDVPERGIYTLANRISIGLAPAGNDSVKKVVINVEGMATLHGELNMKSISDPMSGKTYRNYESRSFKAADIKAGEFVPLVLFGSFWFDEKFKIFRFCGEIEIEPDMSSRILSDIPYYYVIGVKIEPSSKD
ncbi:MAG: DUF5041 domain-containing protein [Bacteroides sp.]|nr:DUF5041 domain-containing protein [Bacteroides sp.]